MCNYQRGDQYFFLVGENQHFISNFIASIFCWAGSLPWVKAVGTSLSAAIKFIPAWPMAKDSMLFISGKRFVWMIGNLRSISKTSEEALPIFSDSDFRGFPFNFCHPFCWYRWIFVHDSSINRRSCTALRSDMFPSFQSEKWSLVGSRLLWYPMHIILYVWIKDIPSTFQIMSTCVSIDPSKSRNWAAKKFVAESTMSNTAFPFKSVGDAT